jgi:adenine-specific DNA-methyltransferase
MSDGFEENAEFFTLTYETPIAVRHNVAFKRIAPLLWIRAGSLGARILNIPGRGWDVVQTYGVLVNLDESAQFCKAVQANKNARIAYIVTDDNSRFQAVTRSLPSSVEPVRLYESYLSNFRFLMGR